VTNEVQTPSVNVTNEVQPAAVENNVTVQPSEVVVQKDGKHEATIERDASGKITKIKSK
jgi:hypothetical protein